MRVLVCGDRNWTELDPILQHLAQYADDTIVIEGEARGADRLAAKSAKLLDFEVWPYPAQWEQYGRAAGLIRNQQMLDDGKPDVVVYFHHNLAESKGTGDMVRRAKRAGIPVINGATGEAG